MDIQKEEEIKLHKKLVKQYQLRYGQDYAKLYHGFWNGEILKDSPANADMFVLDCGCGSGVLFPDLAKKFNNVFGLDLSMDLLKSIKHDQNSHLKGLVVADTEKIPFLDNSFDFIISRSSLHHMPSPINAIKEMYDKLKPGGFFVLSEPCSDSLLLKFPRKLYRENSGRFTEGHKAFSSKELKEKLTGCGFKIKKMRNFGLIAYPLCGLSDFLPVMRFVIFRLALTKILIFLDEIFSKTPLIRNQCWHIIISCEK